MNAPRLSTPARVRVTPAGAELNGSVISTAPLTGLYREFAGNYPKFFKMDSLCRLGFVAAEILLRDVAPELKEHAAVILFNRSGSLVTDRNYQLTLGTPPDGYFPSPALFVYTLANIVTGEIAIRHKIFGETSFYVLPEPDSRIMDEVVADALLTSSPSLILTGWVDWHSDTDYLADLRLLKPQQ